MHEQDILIPRKQAILSSAPGHNGDGQEMADGWPEEERGLKHGSRILYAIYEA